MKRITRVSLVGLILACATSARGESVEWIRQLGTIREDSSRGVSADGLGNVYISGHTSGSLGGPNAGSADAFVIKYDAAGSVLWTRQFGTTGLDESLGVSADRLGNVYVSGITEGSLDGPNAGLWDAFVSKYDAAGNSLWTRQLGTTTQDVSSGVSADGLGNVFISGYTVGSLGGPTAGGYDAFVSKYNDAGSLLWTRQYGTPYYDDSYGVSADGLGNVYIAGTTGGSSDAFVSKYDADGSLLWTRQLGKSGRDISRGVSADGLGNVYHSGFTEGSLGGPNAGDFDAFVSKYDDDGSLLWTRQLGSTGYEEILGVSADGLGNVYLSGNTLGILGGPNAGDSDAFVSKYSAAGSLLWTRQFGTTSNDFSEGVTADGLGNVYLSGNTGGNLGGPNIGRFDVFVAKIVDGVVPEPSGLALSMVGVLGLIVGGRRRWGKSLTA